MTEIKYRKLSELYKLDNNPRNITDEKFLRLCDSVKRNKQYFEARAIILSDRTGKLVVIAGNQRYDAAEYNKMKEVPTILLSGLTKEQEDEIIFKDNIIEGEWDIDLLKTEWKHLPLLDWGVPVPFDNDQSAEPIEIKEVELTAYKKTHVLLSFTPDRMLDIQSLLEQIKSLPGIEYEQSSN